MKSKILGYFYGKSKETPLEALSIYLGELDLKNLCKSYEYAINDFEVDVERSLIRKTCKPKYYRLVIEEVEGE